MAPTASTTVTTTVPAGAAVIVASNGSDTGHVVLGVVGGLVLVLIVVVVIVPLMRWRLNRSRVRAGGTSSEKSQSRASSRRTHKRLESAPGAASPLLGEGGGRGLPSELNTSVVAQWHGSNGRDLETAEGEDEGDEQPTMRELSPDTPNRPASAVFNWKILATLPNFSDETLSSLGQPLEHGDFAGELPPAPSATAVAQEQDRRRDAATSELARVSHRELPAVTTDVQSTTVLSEDGTPLRLVASPTALSPGSQIATGSPLTRAFQSQVSPSASMATLPHSTFRYPSLPTSVTTRSTLSSSPIPTSKSPPPPSNSPPPPLHMMAVASSSSGPSQPSLLPNAFAAMSGPDVFSAAKTGSEMWWRTPMPSIPESVRSSQSNPAQVPELANPHSPPAVARLRDAPGSAPLAVSESGEVQDLGYLNVGPSASTGSDPAIYGHSHRASMVGSIISSVSDTHHTFGRRSQYVTAPPPDSSYPFTSTTVASSIPASAIPEYNTVPFPASPFAGQDPSFENQQLRRPLDELRSRFSTPSASSLGVETVPEGSHRVSYDYPREPSPPLVPVPLPHQPPSHRSSPVLKPQTTPLPASDVLAPQLLLRPVSPLQFDDNMFALSRVGTPAPSEIKRAPSSKRSSMSIPVLPPPPTAKRRSKSGTLSSKSSTSGSSSLRSRSQSRSRRASRRVTFGGLPPDSATSATFDAASGGVPSVPPLPQAPAAPPVATPLQLTGFSHYPLPPLPNSPVSSAGSPQRPQHERTGSGSSSEFPLISPTRRLPRPLPIPPISGASSPTFNSPVRFSPTSPIGHLQHRNDPAQNNDVDLPPVPPP